MSDHSDTHDRHKQPDPWDPSLDAPAGKEVRGTPGDLEQNGGEARPPSPTPGPSQIRRIRAFWLRHRTLFWILHSVWALFWGVVVIVLAHERYGFVPWVLVFLGLTWGSTLFFGRRIQGAGARRSEDTPDGDPALPAPVPEEESPAPVHAPGSAPSKSHLAPPGFLDEVASYLTRIIYQETLFFLFPFYAYSTVPGSPNVAFLILLGGLAVFACLDLAFDRLLRSSPVFGMVFFATVAFAAFNLVLPLLLSIPPRFSAPTAGILAVGSAVPLALRSAAGRGLGFRIRVGLAAAFILALAVGVPRLIPPVPLRMQDAFFGPDIDRSTLALTDTLAGPVPASRLPKGPVVVVRVFAPSVVPTVVHVEWRRNGQTVRTSREIQVTAHYTGFRVWDSAPPGPRGTLPGTYQVILWTPGHRVFGVAELRVVPG